MNEAGRVMASELRVSVHHWTALAHVAGLLMLLSASAMAAEPARPENPVAVSPAAEPADLVISNRVVFTFRAALLGYPPAARAEAARQRIEDILRSGQVGEVSASQVESSMAISIGGKVVFAIWPGDVDTLAGQTQEGLAAAAVRNLEVAIAEARELRQPGMLLRAILLAAAALVAFLGFLLLLRRTRRRLEGWMVSRAEARALRLVFRGFAPLQGTHARKAALVLARLSGWSVGLIATYLFVAFELERFPYTRPWGEHLGGFLARTAWTVVSGVASGVPGLVTALLILLLARAVVWVINAFFRGIDERRIEVGAALRETSVPTRRIAVAVTWLFALVMAYPYLPGSDSAAFKGVSVFIGLMATLGGSSLFGQAASGLMLMYARSLKVGDYVRVDKHEGTVTSMGLLATKIRTPKEEEISIPNSVLVGTVTKNLSRLAGEQGVILYTSVTIGYDAPWRQVHAMLLTAADRTPGLRKGPPPFVWQWALSDFYVEYQLNARLERPEQWQPVMAALHANIQDAFNEYGVQIMSPHFMANPPAKVWVPREHWHEAPAPPTTADGGPAGRGSEG